MIPTDVRSALHGLLQRAEAMYRRCLAVNPEHSYALYNLAVLKEETTKNGDYSEVGRHGV